MDLPSYLTPSELGTVIDVFVQPGAARDAIAGVHGTSLKLKVRARPVDNRANRAVERFLAGVLGTKASKVSVVSGASSRFKRIEVAGLPPEAVAEGLKRAS